MTNKHKIIWSPTFKNELDNILYYLTFKLKEPMIAKKFYRKVLKSLSTLEYFPKGYTQLYLNNKAYRKLLIDNYIVIYELEPNTRTSFYSTYFSWESKLFK